MKSILFLDCDGVLNCEIYYNSQGFKDYKEAKKSLKKDVKSERIERLDYYQSQICKERMSWLNELCKETDSAIVVSSTWRHSKTVEELQEIFNYCGATFTVIDKTPSFGHLRGPEIYEWIKENTEKYFPGIAYYDFKNYAIIDDDSDMLLWQAPNFFQTDSYSGLTPNTCYKIKRFLSCLR